MQTTIKIVMTVLFLLTITSNSYSQGEVFLTEGFESGARPTGWSEVKISGLKYWDYENGGGAYSYLPDFKHPSAAHTGNYNALFFSEGVGPSSRLITPAINLSLAIKPVLSFWLAMDSWDGSTDELKVYYRTKSYNDWEELETFSTTLSVWTKKEIILPADAKVSTLQIAFLATSNYGWGVCLDDVIIDERGVLPRSVNTVNMYQTKETVPSGTPNNPISFVEVGVSGNTGSLDLTQATFNYIGSSIDEINSFRLYYTRDSIFTPTALINGTLSIVGNSVQFSGFTQSLQLGLNYIWVCADARTTAIHGNNIDLELPANGLTINSITYPSVAKSPAGNSKIEQSIISYDFDSATSWSLNNSWAIGVPLGGGTYDPTYSYSGTNVMATDLNGNYPANITEGSEHIAISPQAIATYFKSVNLRYRRWLNVESTDKARVWLSNDGGTSWTKITENSLSIQDRIWKNMLHDISTLSTRKTDVRVRFSIDESDGTTEYGGWNIDNFAITGDFIASDVGVKSMTAPVSKCGLTSAETVKVIVKNYGGATVSTPFDVGYSLDNGTTWVKQSFTNPIDSEEEIEFTFDQTANFSTAGLKQLKFKTFLTGDEDTGNDAYSKTFYIFPSVGIPYYTSFESSNGYWYSSGTNSSWAWGVPSGTNIKSASNGTKAWVTNLSSTYNFNEFSYLESPCFDLSSAEYPVLAFDYMMQTEEGEDGFAVEYSIDGGLSWKELPANVNYAYNWYNTPTVTALSKAGWSQNQLSYVTVKNLLPTDAIGVNGVKFRFVFASTASTSYEGVAIDQVKVYELPNDVSITALTSPISACEIGKSVQLTFTVKNIGYRPMLNGQKIPLVINVDSTNDIKDTLTLAADFNQNDELSHITTDNYNLYAAGTHYVDAYSNLTIEDDRTNDTLHVQVQVTGMPGYTLGADIGTMTTDTITLDAGSGYTTYQWRTKIPEDVGTWTDDATAQTLDVGVDSWGLYAIHIVNGNGCEKNDTIEIIQSDKNLGVISINNLSSACTHASPISPEITIKHFGDTDYGATPEDIPVAISINGEEVLSETFSTPANWAVNSTETFTFTGTIDLSEVGDYDIAIYTNLAKDLYKNNDTSKVSVSTYGMPTVELAYDTISSTQADSLEFSVPDEYATYTWEQKILGETTWTTVGDADTLAIINLSTKLRSATYRITVTDNHSCGSAKDSVFVNAQDLGIFSIDDPEDTICYRPEGITFKMRIKNYGQDVYPDGTSIAAVLTTQSEQKNMNIILDGDLTPGNMTLVSFDEPVMLEPGSHFINVATSISGDPNPDNDYIEKTFKIDSVPTVNIALDTLFMVFNSSTYTISPTYSSDCANYLWQDNYTDSTYTISSPLFDTYKVTASNAHECSASDSLIVISTDISIDAIKSPVNQCVLVNDSPVTISITNTGNRDIAAGTKINVSLYVNGTLSSTEQVELASLLAVDGSTDITLTNTVDIGGLSTAAIYVEVEMVDIKDVVATNNSIDKTVYATGYPSISLGADREVHAISEVLRPGSNFSSYLWQDLTTTDSTFTATTTGNYSVTVTDYYGCTGSDDVNLTFYEDDISVTALNSPSSANGCTLGSAEAVNITIQNTGTWTIPASTVIGIGFTQNNTTKTENYSLTADLAPDATLNIPLTNTMDFTTKKTHDISIWAKLGSDMDSSNDTLETQVAAYPEVLVSLGDDIVSNSAEILNPGGGYNSYLWSTNATSQTITVNTTGEYWVEVSNTYGCTARDTINYTFSAVPDLQLLELGLASSSCSLSNNESVTAYIKNIGNYVFLTGEQISLELKENETTVATETIPLSEDLAINDTLEYTFTHRLDLSNPATYTIKVTLTQASDSQTGNNVQENTVTVWGYPAVSLGNDTTICQGETLTLNAGNTGNSYTWNTTATSKTIDVTTSDTYWVDVSDVHTCTTRDSIVVTVNNLPTVTHTAIDPTCINKEEFALTGGSPANGTYTGTGVSGTSFDPATAGLGIHTLTYTFTDAYGCSNSTTVDITVNSAPTVDLGENRTINEPITLNPGSGYTSYQWQDNSTNQTLVVQSSGLYSVTVTDANGCEGYDEVYITYQETISLMVTNLTSPVSKCFDENNTSQAVTIEVTNQGTKTFTSGEQIGLSYRIGATQPVMEQYTFTSDVAQNGKIQHTFTNSVDLMEGTHTFTCYATIAGEKGDSTDFDVSIYSLPTFSFEDDTIRTSLTLQSYVLQSGIGNVSYLWSTGATSPSITVSQYGEYWLRVTDAHTCVASDTVVIWWPTSAEVISGIDAKVKLFPNPVKDELNVWIESTKEEVYSLELINPIGLIVQRQLTTKSEKITDVIEMNNYNSGVYLLKISTSKGSAVFKIIVNR